MNAERIVVHAPSVGALLVWLQLPREVRAPGPAAGRVGACPHVVQRAPEVLARSSRLVAMLEALDVPLRDRNQALCAAGFAASFPEPALAALPAPIEEALARMMETQEPYPWIVVSPEANVLRSNRAATSLFVRFVAEPAALEALPNRFSLVFDPRLMRPFITNWGSVARQMPSRLHRESLQRGGDERLGALTRRVRTFPTSPSTGTAPISKQLSSPHSPFISGGATRFGVLHDDYTFSSPRLVTLDELRIESSFPLDAATRRFCETEVGDVADLGRQPRNFAP